MCQMMPWVRLQSSETKPLLERMLACFQPTNFSVALRTVGEGQGVDINITPMSRDVAVRRSHMKCLVKMNQLYIFAL